ncbi:Uma2 family endonuclease [Tundrisphaera sp. TA3]|uniref:Uma2 family endonuclease n=1 Tax=Tundrisphaera sp. TA3 TaxID=3435775 RepID=UPI003EBD0141
MSTATTKLLSADDLWHLPDTGLRRELIGGEVRETMPPGGLHGAIAVALATLLRIWAKPGGAGYVGVEAGYILARDPDTVRGPDVSYVRADRIPARGIPEGFWEIAPDLAVEVVSPSETAEDVRAKVRDFLAAGTRLVWVVYPRSREVIAHLPDGRAWAIAAGDRLESPEILPGFSCAVADLFD